MLVQFSVENFKSIEDEIVLKMIAGPPQAHISHLMETDFKKPRHLLRFAAIYGANASGKTNLIEAVRYAQELLFSGIAAEDPINPPKFRFAGSDADRPTCMEFIFWLNEELYTYGFAVNDAEVKEEWLFAQRSGAAERKLFTRESNKDGAVVSTGKSLEEKDFSASVLSMIAHTTRKNQLYLHELMDKNHKGILPVLNWFGDTVTVVSAVAQHRQLLLKARNDQKFTDYLSKLLNKAGTGIERVELKGREIEPKQDLYYLPPGSRQEIEKELRKLEEGQGIMLSMPKMQRIYEMKDGKVSEYHLRAIHKNKLGNEISLPIEEESDGTQRLVHLAPLFADAVEQDKIIFIDELDRRLHPLLSKTLVQLFNETGAQNSRTQLIFSTHDTNLFDQELLRRDELWLIEKNEYGASRLTSLLEFDIRNDFRLSKNYLQGRFGGIPNVRRGIISEDKNYART